MQHTLHCIIRPNSTWLVTSRVETMHFGCVESCRDVMSQVEFGLYCTSLRIIFFTLLSTAVYILQGALYKFGGSIDYLSDVDPSLDDISTFCNRRQRLLHDCRNDAIRHGIELFHGGINGSHASRMLPAVVATWPHRTETLVWHDSAKQLLTSPTFITHRS